MIVDVLKIVEYILHIKINEKVKMISFTYMYNK